MTSTTLTRARNLSVLSKARAPLILPVLLLGACTSDGGDEDDDIPGIDASTPRSDAGGPTETDPTNGFDSGPPPITDGGPDPFDAGDLDAGNGGGMLDAGDGRDAASDSGSGDSGLPDSSVTLPDSGDPQVFEPDGGVVVRPTELQFDPEYVQRLTVPDGFRVEVYATPGGQTRMLRARGTDLYITRPMQGDVLCLTDEDADGIPDSQAVAAADLPMVHGIAFEGATVYLATTTELYRGSVAEDCTFEDLMLLADDLPDGGQHGLRTLGVSPDSELFLSIGSSCDACNETNPEHATLQQVASDGSRTTYASGLRNTIGFDWHPTTGQLWGMDNGSDWRGNDLPPEELNLLEPNTNYGWPYCFGDQQVDPIIADPASQTKEQYCPTTAAPAFVDDAHQAPIGFTFYGADAYPAEYVGDAFVAMRGSWNRNPPTGYKISRIDFVDGVPMEIQDFVSGFLNEAGDATFARPAGVTVDSTGSVVFSDDTNGVLYRVTLEP